MRMLDAVHQYVADPSSNLTTRASREAYRRTLTTFDTWAGHPTLDQVTERQMVDWIIGRRLAPGTQANNITRLQGFFGWAHWKGLVDVNPAAHLKRALPGATHARPVRQHVWLEPDEIDRIISTVKRDHVGVRDEVLLRLGFTAGLRREEIVNLTWGQVDLKRRQITFVGKGRKLAQVYITPNTLAAIERWLALWAVEADTPKPTDPVLCRARSQWNASLDGRTLEIVWGSPLTHSGLRKVIDRAVARSGIRFAAHDMRRSFAGIMYGKVGLEQTSKALRHSNLGVTERYLESRTDAAYQAVRDAGVDV